MGLTLVNRLWRCTVKRTVHSIRRGSERFYVSQLARHSSLKWLSELFQPVPILFGCVCFTFFLFFCAIAVPYVLNNYLLWYFSQSRIEVFDHACNFYVKTVLCGFMETMLYSSYGREKNNWFIVKFDLLTQKNSRSKVGRYVCTREEIWMPV
jgi:hypothetical protein